MADPGTPPLLLLPCTSRHVDTPRHRSDTCSLGGRLPTEGVTARVDIVLRPTLPPPRPPRCTFSHAEPSTKGTKPRLSLRPLLLLHQQRGRLTRVRAFAVERADARFHLTPCVARVLARADDTKRDKRDTKGTQRPKGQQLLSLCSARHGAILFAERRRTSSRQRTGVLRAARAVRRWLVAQRTVLGKCVSYNHSGGDSV